MGCTLASLALFCMISTLRGGGYSVVFKPPGRIGALGSGAAVAGGSPSRYSTDEHPPHVTQSAAASNNQQTAAAASSKRLI